MGRKRQSVAQKRVAELAKARNIKDLQMELGESSRTITTGDHVSSLAKGTKCVENPKRVSTDSDDPSDEIPLNQLLTKQPTAPESDSAQLSNPNPALPDDTPSPGNTDDQVSAAITKDNNQECSCGLQATVSQLQLQVNKLEIENDQLKKKIANMKNKRSILKLRNQKLEQSLVSKVLPEPARPFKDVEGFPTAEDIMNMSVRAEDSDYLFIKFLMYAIWPEGFKQRSVTGRISNNPKGRPKKRKAEEDHIDESSNLRECEEIEDAADDTEDGNIDTGSTSATPDTRCIALEAAKIDFVRARLLERRLFLHDDGVVAKKVSDGCKRLMQMVISNSKRH